MMLIFFPVCGPITALIGIPAVLIVHVLCPGIIPNDVLLFITALLF